MSWKAFFFNLRRQLVIFCDRFVCMCVCIYVCVCLTGVTHWMQTHKCMSTRNRTYAWTCTHTQAPCCPGDTWSRAVVSCPWGFGSVWVGLLILTVWPYLASCQCRASSRWLLWPPINQGQLLRWCTVASLPAVALPCRVQGGEGKGKETTSLLWSRLPLCLALCTRKLWTEHHDW